MWHSPGADARDPTVEASSGSITDPCNCECRAVSMLAVFRALALPARRAKQASAPPQPRYRAQRPLGQLIDKDNLEHREVRRSEDGQMGRHS